MERKLATVLFVDLVDSTGMVTSSDPEVVRRRLTAFFEAVSHCIEANGGTVEKFAGDAVMAAFGIPRAHEDDAERAIRAALGIRRRLDELGLAVRIGVEAGEVVADGTADSTFATGEAVNVAARLQQAAAPGDILVGPGAYRLAHAALDVEALGPRHLRGRAEPVLVWRATGVSDGAAARATAVAPLVGRDAELELLRNTFARTVRDRRTHLFTIYGEPGVGKSRLAREFGSGLEGATVLQGRALPYGEGITYWPLAEMVKAAAGVADDEPVDEAFEKLREMCEDEAVADLLALAVGVLDAVRGERAPQEIAWAARAWAETLALAQPLVLVFEDIHWAEEPLLDLVEHIASSVRDAPLLIVCLARPELLDSRPTWGGGRVRATAIELEPLPREDSEALVDALLAESELPSECRDEILETAEGNPLYLEETVRMLAEGDGGGRVGIPDTLQALIAARIDRLPRESKIVLQRAAVIGRVVWAGALEHLSPDLDDVEGAVEDLLRREFLLREQRSTITAERALRFKHILIREIAYAALPKSDRAGYHARFAEWLSERAGEELLEIRAYHLDRAATLLGELDGSPPRELARDAAAALHKAGKRAFARESFKTARKLLLRSVELEPTLDRKYMAARAAWRLGDLPAVAAEMTTVRDGAREAGDRYIEGRALTALAEVALYHGADVQAALRLVETALETLADEPEPQALVDVLMMRSQIASWLGDGDGHRLYAERALAVAQESERKDLEVVVIESLASRRIVELELDEAEPLVERARELAEESGSVLARAKALSMRASLDRLHGRLDDAAASLARVRELYADVGYNTGLAYAAMQAGRLARRRGDFATAEADLREAVRIFKSIGDRGFLCEALRSLAELTALQGSLDEAERLALEARESVGPEDRVSISTTKLSLGVVRAAQGRDDEAEKLMCDAVAELTGSGFTLPEREALESLALFLRERGRASEAEELEVRAAELSRAAGRDAAAIA